MPNPTFVVRPVDRLEDAALLHALGAEFVRAEPLASRISLFFQVDTDQLAALRHFQAGRGPRIVAARFADSMRWARDRVFSAHREAGLEKGGRGR